ncbi:MAG: YabP/YqfC family sporulation protein [Oscillospiraceae bacterium]|nr:YabP/YqfC family sporulation protein [Oscillospiraceae bacterium]
MKKLLEKFEGKLKSSIYLDSCITVRACNAVKIENCTRVLECDDILIKIRTTDCDVSIWGESLKLECYNENIISVYGKVTSIEFEAKKK